MSNLKNAATIMDDIFKDSGLPNFFSKQGFAIVIGLLGTGIGAYGGMPAPPKTFVKAVDKYPLLQWFLVYVLIWQGAGGFDEKLSLYGTILIFAIYKIMIHAERHWDLLYHLGLNEKRRAQKKQENEDEDLKTNRRTKSNEELLKKAEAKEDKPLGWF